MTDTNPPSRGENYSGSIEDWIEKSDVPVHEMFDVKDQPFDPAPWDLGPTDDDDDGLDMGPLTLPTPIRLVAGALGVAVLAGVGFVTYTLWELLRILV